MRKSVFAFVVVTILAMAIPASAQSIRWGYIPQTPDGWYYKIRGDQVGMLTADNLGMVRNLTNQLRRSEIRSLRDDLRWNGTAYGLQVGQGFYPMYDRNRRPMSRGKATAIGAGVGAGIGAGIGYGIARNSHGRMSDGRSALLGAGIGAAGGALIGLLTHRDGDKNVVVTPTESRPPVYWSHGGPVSSGGASSYWGPGTPNRRPNCMEQGMATLENQSEGPLRVFKDREPFEVLMPKEQKCAPLEGNYTGEIVGTIVGRDGLTGRVGVAPAKPQSLPGLVLVWR